MRDQSKGEKKKKAEKKISPPDSQMDRNGKPSLAVSLSPSLFFFFFFFSLSVFFLFLLSFLTPSSQFNITNPDALVPRPAIATPPEDRGLRTQYQPNPSQCKRQSTLQRPKMGKRKAFKEKNITPSLYPDVSRNPVSCSFIKHQSFQHPRQALRLLDPSFLHRQWLRRAVDSLPIAHRMFG